MDLVQIPEAISTLAVEMAREGFVWAYAELPDGRFKHWKDLNVSDFEQLTQVYTERARKAIGRYLKKPSSRRARAAAEFIDRARLYRSSYREAVGLPQDERDMPFPIMSEDEAKSFTQPTESPDA